VRRTVPPSAEIEEQIDRLLAVGVGENSRESLSELAKLGARLIIQRAVEEEFDAWPGRARYERRPDYQRGLRNGFRPRRVQTAEGELQLERPQVRAAAEPFVAKLFPRGTKLLRTEPLRAMVIGAFVRGLSMHDVESLCEQAGRTALTRARPARREQHRCSESCRSRPRHASAANCVTGSLRSSAAISMTSRWRRCSWTRSFSRSAPTGPRRACSWRGGSPMRASACFWP
jgi:Transposase, Mutator family